jgi:hypothetical protein
MQIFAKIVFFLAALNMAAHAADRLDVLRGNMLKIRNAASAETLSIINGSSAASAFSPRISAPASSNYSWLYH